MSSIKESDQLITTRLVQVLSQEHNVYLSFKDPDLISKIHKEVVSRQDQVLNALWKILSSETQGNVESHLSTT